MRFRRRTVAWLLLAFVLALVTAAVQGGPPEVSAHALLVRADPPVNAQLREAPTMLTLYFSEPVERKFSGVRVTDQNNVRMDDRVAFDDADNALMRVYLKPLTPGYITVNWETVSAADGHRVSGSYPLTLLNPNGSVPAGRPSSVSASVNGASPKPARVADRWIILMAACVMVGAFAFSLFVTPGLSTPQTAEARRAMDKLTCVGAAIALVVLLPAGGIELLLQSSNIGASVSQTVATHWGKLWLLGQLILLAPLLAILAAAMAPSIGWLRRLAILIGLAGGAAYLGTAAAASHASVGEGSFWSMASDFVHLVAVAVWLGGLALLALLFVWAHKHLARGERFAVLGSALRGFSVMALASVVALLLTGVVNGVIEIGRLSDMVETGYGRTLLLKLVLMVPLLVMGGLNGYVFRPQMATARRDLATLADLERRMNRWVRWELVAGAAVLAVAGLLGQQTPSRGRLSAPTQSGKYTASMGDQGIDATLVIDPNQPGINSFEVYLTGSVDQVEEVRLDFTAPKGGGADSRLIMDESNPPTFFVGKGPFLTANGKWKVGVDIRRSRGTDLLLPFVTQVSGGAAQVTTSRTGGAFGSPISFSPLSAGVLTATLVGLVALAAGSFRPRERVGGYTGSIATAMSRKAASRRMRPAWSLGGLLIVGVGFGLIVGGYVFSQKKLSPQDAVKGNPVQSTPASIQRGQVLFLQNCTQCHGESGRGDGPLAKSLPIPPANLYLHVPYHPDQFFFGIMTNGLSGIMPSFSATIGETDRWNILNYLRATYSVDPADK